MSWKNILKAFGYRKPAKKLAAIFDNEFPNLEISFSQYDKALDTIKAIVTIIKKDKEETPQSPEEIKKLVNILNQATDNKLTNSTQEFLDYYMEDFNRFNNKVLFGE
tara:strand:- start:22795 stop:23115 length:321 start_codon:yes stop_codon:yes gene_type:complete